MSDNERITRIAPEEFSTTPHKRFHRWEFKDENGQAVASARMSYHSRPFPHVYIAGLGASKQFKGFGSKLLAAIEEKIKKTGRAGILENWIDERAPAYGMYERRGWTLIHDGKPDKPFKNLCVFNLPDGADIERLKAEYAVRKESRIERIRRAHQADMQDFLKKHSGLKDT